MAHWTRTAELPDGWFHEWIGPVLVRTERPRRLSFDQLVAREVESSVELGDPRPLPELEADIRADLRHRVDQYRRALPVSRG